MISAGASERLLYDPHIVPIKGVCNPDSNPVSLLTDGVLVPAGTIVQPLPIRYATVLVICYLSQYIVTTDSTDNIHYYETQTL